MNSEIAMPRSRSPNRRMPELNNNQDTWWSEFRESEKKLWLWTTCPRSKDDVREDRILAVVKKEDDRKQ